MKRISSFVFFCIPTGEWTRPRAKVVSRACHFSIEFFYIVSENFDYLFEQTRTFGLCLLHRHLWVNRLTDTKMWQLDVSLDCLHDQWHQYVLGHLWKIRQVYLLVLKVDILNQGYRIRWYRSGTRDTVRGYWRFNMAVNCRCDFNVNLCHRFNVC